LEIWSFRGPNGMVPGNVESTYDTYVSGGDFVGPNAEAAYGGAIPLTISGPAPIYDHFGNTLSELRQNSVNRLGQTNLGFDERDSIHVQLQLSNL
jgi:hypothetical protein